MRIRIVCKARGWSRDNLAERARISPSQLSRIETSHERRCKLISTAPAAPSSSSAPHSLLTLSVVREPARQAGNANRLVSSGSCVRERCGSGQSGTRHQQRDWAHGHGALTVEQLHSAASGTTRQGFDPTARANPYGPSTPTPSATTSGATGSRKPSACRPNSSKSRPSSRPTSTPSYGTPRPP
ncbi:helix-turn-helix transcriptional regulator [Streptomyces sp. IMTB 2501]|uniref:helix-turn-helix domain-containing protein n=1 Tax=Streptomyces sp. IMTB 2501 TaxID=1776340 RepID=UPI0021170633|nr:helix-turn-helix transcriptional regulator [Streptomyces sp. IMTB 2501]